VLGDSDQDKMLFYSADIVKGEECNMTCSIPEMDCNLGAICSSVTAVLLSRGKI
jgi:hypothetical protein